MLILDNRMPAETFADRHLEKGVSGTEIIRTIYGLADATGTAAERS